MAHLPPRLRRSWEAGGLTDIANPQVANLSSGMRMSELPGSPGSVLPQPLRDGVSYCNEWSLLQ